jgi:hypothetical protein
MRPFLLLAIGAVIAATGCTPLTYHTRLVSVQQLPAHPLPAGATYTVVVPATSVGAAQLTSGIRIPGATIATSPETAEVTIEAAIGQPSLVDLTVSTTQVQRVVSSGGPSEVTVYGYRGTVVTPRTLHITSKTHGPLVTQDQPQRSPVVFDQDPTSRERFANAMNLEWSFTRARPALLQQAAVAEVQRLQDAANAAVANHFTAHQERLVVQLATEHTEDPRFGQATMRFDQAIVGMATDQADFAARLAPAIDLWQQVVTTPVGSDAAARSTAKGAGLFNLAVGYFLLNRLDDAERSLLEAQALGSDPRWVNSLRLSIQDRRQRGAAQEHAP